MPVLAADWSFPTAFHLGAGRIAELPQQVASVGMRRPLVVTDPGLVALPPMDRVREGLEAAGLEVAVFSQLRPNPRAGDVAAGVERHRAGGHDGVIAVGGGSALDVGKLVAFMAGQRRPLGDFEDVGDHWKRADPHAIAPCIAVPTTAGTGSEVGRAGVVVDEATRRKLIVFHPGILPRAVLCDPELTLALPRALTVGTGMDALSHSLEAVCAPAYHPMAQGIGLEGCRLVLEHLPRVAADPADLESRTHMMVAAAMGAVAFQKGLGGMHALSHPIGARFDTHHGMTNAVVMPYVLVANRPAVEGRLTGLAAWCGVEGGFDGLLSRVLALREELGVPHSLVELGVDPAAADPIAQDAVKDPSAAGNPRPFDHDLARRLFEAACRGDLERAAAA